MTLWMDARDLVWAAACRWCHRRRPSSLGQLKNGAGCRDADRSDPLHGWVPPSAVLPADLVTVGQRLANWTFDFGNYEAVLATYRLVDTGPYLLGQELVRSEGHSIASGPVIEDGKRKRGYVVCAVTLRVSQDYGTNRRRDPG
jgi:hypothetical protein